MAFIKQADVTVEQATTNACWIKFGEAGFHFNKCEPDSPNFIKH
jgi:hypothetical protein